MDINDLEWRIREADEVCRLIKKALETAVDYNTIDCLTKALEHLTVVHDALVEVRDSEATPPTS